MSIQDIKLNGSQILQLALIIGPMVGAWYSLSTDMAIIQLRLEVSKEFVAKTEKRMTDLEERMTNAETVQRDMWRDVRGQRERK